MECSHLKTEMKLEDVKWVEDDLIWKDRFHSMVGRWIPPDTVVLDRGYIEDTTVIQHELLHVVLSDPTHPIYYFVTLCHLMQPPIGG